MNPVAPISPSSTSPSGGVSTSIFTPPPAASVAAFEALMGTEASSLEGQIFGHSAMPGGAGTPDSAPIFKTPPLFDYLNGALSTLDRLHPSLPNRIPSATELTFAQLQASALQLSWQLTGKLVGTSVQGLNTLVNSQV